MDSQDFTYNNWRFHRESDGSLIIEPSSGDSGSNVFSEKGTGNTKMSNSITIPKEQAQRLLAYCISGSPNKNEVVSQVRDLEKQYGLVTA